MQIIKDGERVNVSFSMTLPTSATVEQIGEWLSFELHELGGMNGTNPLADYDIEATFKTVKWELET